MKSILFNPNGSRKVQSSIDSLYKAFAFNENLSKIYPPQNELTEQVFHDSIKTLMSKFGMTRRGPFSKQYINGTLDEAWSTVHTDATKLRRYLNSLVSSRTRRERLLLSPAFQTHGLPNLATIFNRLVEVCWVDNCFGMVGASKLLFCIFPEVAIPVDNQQIRSLFRSIDYLAIMEHMITEIKRWERKTDTKLTVGDSNASLAMIYNTVAMASRP